MLKKICNFLKLSDESANNQQENIKNNYKVFLFGVCFIFFDLIITYYNFQTDNTIDFEKYRWVISLLGIFILIYLTKNNVKYSYSDLKSIFDIKPDKKIWFKIIFIFTIAFFIFHLLFITIVYNLKIDIHLHRFARDPKYFKNYLFNMCVYAPFTEELIYRLILCLTLLSYLKKWTIVFISGFLFALTHFIYGNPGIDNFLAGYILAWSYYKSRTILIPIILHSIGNLYILLNSMSIFSFIYK